MICKEHGIGRSTITDIKNREPDIQAYKHKMTEMGVGRSAKMMKLGKDKEFEAVLFLWFKQKTEWVPITDWISLIQPMDQGVLESLKRHYRRKILEELILSGSSLVEFLKRINLLKVSELIAACWDEIQPTTPQLS